MRQSLRAFQIIFFLLSMGMIAANAHSQIVISQIYGGGGNSGATYKNDFIELFNRGTSTVDVTGWTIQYASSSGTLWETTSLSGSIQPGAYFLVQEIQGAGGTADLPSPDAVGTIALSATSAKIALTNNGTLLAGACPSSAAIVDLVGYGTADCSEESTAPGLSNTTALFRNNNGCRDTGSNASDFTTGSPNPRNASTPVNQCGATNLTGSFVAIPSTVAPNSSILIVVTVIPASNPTSTGITVTGNLVSIAGSPNQQLYDNGTNGDVTAGDSKFSYQTTVPLGVSLGSHTVAFSITDAQGRSSTVTANVEVESSSFELVFPHFGTGGGWKTTVLLTNSSTASTIATVNFYTASDTPQWGMLVPIPPLGSVKIPAPETASLTTGWVKATTAPAVELGGNLVFQLFSDSSLSGEASVPPAPPVSSVDFYAEEENGYSTGFAVTNPTLRPAEGVLTLRTKEGMVYGTYPFTLQPLEHSAAFLFEKFKDAPSGRAQIDMTKGYVSTIALRFHLASNVFSTLAVNQPGFSSASAAPLFSPQGGVSQRIISEINKAQATIDIAIYSFTSDAIRNALISAQNRGVQIRIIADTSQSEGTGSELPLLEQMGFQIKRTNGGSGGIMHNKYMIIDGQILLTGSYNWSANAEENNYENAVFVQGSSVVKRYIDDFNNIWIR